MIQAMALMVGACIITRMINLVLDQQRETGFLTMIFAVITILIAGFCIYIAITAGEQISNL